MCLNENEKEFSLEVTSSTGLIAIWKYNSESYVTEQAFHISLMCKLFSVKVEII